MADDKDSHHSAFGGLPLNQVAGLRGDHVEKLHGLGIFDAEQLLGVVAAMGGTKELAAGAGLTEPEIAALVKAATGALPEHVAQQHSVSQHINYSLGALDLTDEKKKQIEEHHARYPQGAVGFVAAVLPANVNHISGMEPVQNQGARGTCVGFGSTALHEYQWFVAQKTKLKLSEEFVYDLCKTIDGQPAGCGTWLLDAVKILIQYGQCTEAMLPYNPNLPCNQQDNLTPQIMQDAATRKSSPTLLQNAKNTGAMKTALALHNSNVGFCIPVFNSWYRNPTTAKTGQFPMPLPNEKSIGGHCMCLVGYQDNASYPGGGYFILRNSWGTGWAPQCPYGAGYGNIPYAFLSGYCTEAASY